MNLSYLQKNTKKSQNYFKLNNSIINLEHYTQGGLHQESKTNITVWRFVALAACRLL